LQRGGDRLNDPQGPEPDRLIRRAIGGDQGAFGELIRRYEGAAFRLALRITGSRADAEDCVQEAFLRAYRALARFEQGRPFGPWILRITANRAMTRAGRRKKERPLAEAERLPEAGPEMDAALGNKEELEHLRLAVSALPPQDRAIIGLRYEEGLKVAEISRVLGLTLSAAKVRLFRAREKLMRILEDRP